MGPRVLAWMKNTQYVGAVACDGEWLVVVGCYLLLWVLLVVVPWQDWSVLRSPLPRLPLLDPPSFTYDWVSSASFIVRFVFHFRPFPFLDLPSFTHGLALLDDILVSCLLPSPPPVS